MFGLSKKQTKTQTNSVGSLTYRIVKSSGEGVEMTYVNKSKMMTENIKKINNIIRCEILKYLFNQL